jgi:hypothetical protein
MKNEQMYRKNQAIKENTERNNYGDLLKKIAENSNPIFNDAELLGEKR